MLHLILDFAPKKSYTKLAPDFLSENTKEGNRAFLLGKNGGLPLVFFGFFLRSGHLNDVGDGVAGCLCIQKVGHAGRARPDALNENDSKRRCSNL